MKADGPPRKMYGLRSSKDKYKEMQPIQKFNLG